MNSQYQSSITHTNNISSGLTIVAHREAGEGDSAVSLVRYSDGSTWCFSTGYASRLDRVYGYSEDNRSQESAWFLTEDRASEFNRGCGGEFGTPEQMEADSVDINDIIL